MDSDLDTFSATVSPVSIASSEDDAVGLSNRQLSQGRRKMLDITNRLHTTGVQIDLDLPQIVFTGIQSAGKSSLVQAVAGVPLPRTGGTCTRIPTEIRLAYADDLWQCIVSLRFITDTNGQPLGQVRNEIFGDAIYDVSEVEERVRRAQRAILNPSTPARQFLDGEDEDPARRQLGFSTNYVSLSISGRGVADLSLCDLPGLISAAGEGRSAAEIDLVKNLVTSYIQKPSCIVLCTVACETDFENQGAHHLAKLYDPEGKRTIGVLTKPDRMNAGEEDLWLRFIRSECEVLENGWYCVKQPNAISIAQGITWPEARAEEDEYFSSTPPWSTLDSVYQRYLRTSNLTERLSFVLSDLISKRLPEIHEEVQALIRKTEVDLLSLPKPPSNDALAEVSHAIMSFQSDLAHQLQGTGDSDGLMQLFRPSQATFLKTIRRTGPKFSPYDSHVTRTDPVPIPSFLTEDEKAQEQEVRKDPQYALQVVHVDKVFTKAQEARSRELPDNYPYSVQKSYIQAITRTWRNHALELVNAEQVVLNDFVRKLVVKHFASVGRGALQQAVLLVVNAHLHECWTRTKEKVTWLMDIEEHPFTMNDHYYAEYKDKFLTFYRGCRSGSSEGALLTKLQDYDPHPPTSSLRPAQARPSPFDIAVAQVISALPQIGITGTKVPELARLLGQDTMDPALHIMANVSAYFQVAYRRFTDMIALAIDHELAFGLERNLVPALFAGLMITGPDGMAICQDYVQEQPHISAKREDYQRKLDRLTAARSELLQLKLQ
ncbi:hypothetical protein FA95DRAFT_1118899 [Auriscalpium vulgare]|uniref:Uncharacterized protein n=1 Tax=Auriscalpium vulgare TaxID=40419 RepID=A0ACB8RVM9_9AGAM|nr:hypothetical protein FA95DRAFT_1118899 [Auriscalpium vulgare]